MQCNKCEVEWKLQRCVIKDLLDSLAVVSVVVVLMLGIIAGISSETDFETKENFGVTNHVDYQALGRKQDKSTINKARGDDYVD